MKIGKLLFVVVARKSYEYFGQTTAAIATATTATTTRTTATTTSTTTKWTSFKKGEHKKPQRNVTKQKCRKACFDTWLLTQMRGTYTKAITITMTIKMHAYVLHLMFYEPIL